MFAIGFDIGSSSVKASLIDLDATEVVATVQSPVGEMGISAPAPGWAEQDPDLWWEHVCTASRKLREHVKFKLDGVAAIGVAYQMHGLVLVDENHRPVRPSIIWCDSRAVPTGQSMLEALGPDRCLSHLLNAPGNFTASRLKWVMDNEPLIHSRARYFMLPGDYIALRMTGEATTTPGGLSEGILWDFVNGREAGFVFDHLESARRLMPRIVPNIGIMGRLTHKAAGQLGLSQGTPVSYRAGDQPNNALALGVTKPGEVAGTGGTSGVIYAVSDRAIADPLGRINTFAHVNYSKDAPNTGILLCINGTGICYAWVRARIADAQDYGAMEHEASRVPVGSAGLITLPFGNGAERMLGNRVVGAHLLNIDLNRHSDAHIYRSALEGIAFAFAYGLDLVRELGIDPGRIRVGNDNLFQSEVFAKTFATLSGSSIDLVDSTGSTGAALGAALGAGLLHTFEDFEDYIKLEKSIEPEVVNSEYLGAYEAWLKQLGMILNAKQNT